MLAWHFLPQDRRLRYPPHTLVEPGQTLRVDPPIKLCERGLHASVRALDALKYAPGPVVCRVRLGGQIKIDDDKAVATERTCLWMADATQVLHEFACWCAEEALLRERAAGREPDPRSWAAIETKRRWLHGEATEAELAAASEAAWAAAWAAVNAAARVAAEAAALAADRAAVNAAALVADRAIVWFAAWDAARAAQNAKLEEMLEERR